MQFGFLFSKHLGELPFLCSSCLACIFFQMIRQVLCGGVLGFGERAEED